MNIIAIDIGNTNIEIGLFLGGEQQFIKTISGDSLTELKDCLVDAWGQIPVLGTSRDEKRDGVIVISSVKPAWTDVIAKIVHTELDEIPQVIGKDIPLPIPCWVDEPLAVGTDRAVLAAAAHDVVEGPVIVIDCGTALTIDVVDQNGVFQGGAICPGFAISAKALADNTAQLPEIQVHRPETPYGKNTADAINCGIYYSAIGTLQEIIRRYSEELGVWPQTVITGAGAKIIQQDCGFIDSYVPHLVVKGIVMAYKKYLEQRAENI